MIKIKEEQFRQNTDEYFELSGIRECKKLSHHPFLVLNENTIEICDNAKDLIEKYSKWTPVIAQWEGKWESDFFYFLITDLIDFIKKNPKKDYQIV